MRAAGAQERRAHIVVDLGFGDAGKGLVTDHLVRTLNAKLVVRFNGGAQAGHNVVTPDGRHHTFTQFGAGSFSQGVRTFLSRHVVVHPTALLVEAQMLESKGVERPLDRIAMSEAARVITPFHQAANRLCELSRGAARHGSCGIGFGETVKDSLEHPAETVYARDLYDEAALRRKLSATRERKRMALIGLCGKQLVGEPAFAREWAYFERPGVVDGWIEEVRKLARLKLIKPEETLSDWSRGSTSVVFEGAQGVLLDESFGFHPHTTWSTCTATNAERLIAEQLPHHRPVRVGVLRTHAVRHGAGPLPTEADDLRGLITDHNTTNDWQGSVRYGWFDAVLTGYALKASGGVDVLCVTHLDSLRKLTRWPVATSYEGIDALEPPRAQALDTSAELSELLTRAKPVFEEEAPDEGKVLTRIEALLGSPVRLVSRGPSTTDVRVR